MTGKSVTEGRLRAIAGRELPLGALAAWSLRHAAALLIGFVILADSAQYLSNRPLWMDEVSLRAAIEAIGDRGFLSPLANSQLAPPGFLAVEHAALRALGASPYALRLVPLASAIGAIVLFYAVARRCLTPRGVLIALALYAVSDDLIYFSSELKQYMSDVAAALLCTHMGLVAAAEPSATVRKSLLFAILGASVVWFSHPSAFVLAGVGITLMAAALARKRWRELLALALTALAWLFSFAVLYRVSMRHLGPSRGMWAFWAFAFPPAGWNIAWPLQRVGYLFVNPLNFTTPLGPRLSAILPLLLFVAGCVSLGRRAPLRLALLVTPGFVTMGAAYARLYPFHGRLVLFLAPSLLLLIAEGTDRVGSAANRRWVWAALLASLLLFPALSAIVQLPGPRNDRDFNPRGDRRAQRLDPATFPF